MAERILPKKREGGHRPPLRTPKLPPDAAAFAAAVKAQAGQRLDFIVREQAYEPVGRRQLAEGLEYLARFAKTEEQRDELTGLARIRQSRL